MEFVDVVGFVVMTSLVALKSARDGCEFLKSPVNLKVLIPDDPVVALHTVGFSKLIANFSMVVPSLVTVIEDTASAVVPGASVPKLRVSVES